MASKRLWRSAIIYRYQSLRGPRARLNQPEEESTAPIELTEEYPLLQKMMDYMYYLDYDCSVDAPAGVQSHEGQSDSQTSVLALAVEMHAFTDRYAVQGLREVSAMKSRQALCGID